MSPLLTMADLATRYGCSKRSILTMRKARPDFPQPLRPLSPNGWPRWREADIAAWERKHARDAQRVAS